jgi:phytoene dehydrogenase-like protein
MWTVVFLMLAVSQAETEKSVNSTTCDVLVLGAGLAGTSAAWRLVGERPAGTPAPRVCILEASDRIGGRTKDHQIKGCDPPQTVELGAQWIAQEEVDSDVWDLAVNVLGLGIFNGWPWALYGFPYGPAEIRPDVKSALDRVPSATLVSTRSGAAFFGPNVSDTNPQAGKECREKVAKFYDSVLLDSMWDTYNASFLDNLTPLQFLDAMGCNITKDDVVAQGLNQVKLRK